MLAQARATLAARYPTYAEFVPLTLDTPGADYAAQPPRLLDTDRAGEPHLAPLNAGFDAAYLGDPRNPRWVAKPTVAYLHARTVTCKRCRAALPMLKTRWLCRTDRKRVLLTMEPGPDTAQPGVVFGVRTAVPREGANAAQRREHDRRLGAGTMTRAGAACPYCRTIMTMRDIRLEGRAGRLRSVMTAVVVDGPGGKEYRLPTAHERAAAEVTEEQLRALYADIPYGLPEEPTPKAGSGAARAFSVDGCGFDTWRSLFTNRQLLALGTLVTALRTLQRELAGWPAPWREAVTANLAVVIDRLADYSSALCSWNIGREIIRNTFGRFALPIVWDFTEVNPLSDTSGNFMGVSNGWPASSATRSHRLTLTARIHRLSCAAARLPWPVSTISSSPIRPTTTRSPTPT